MPTGPGASKAFRKATAACKRQGKKSFTAGSSGEACRNKLAEKIAEQPKK